jgi:hypothetical protein
MRCLHLIGEVMKQFSPLKAVPRVVKNCTDVSGLAMVHVRIHDRCLYYSLVDRYISARLSGLSRARHDSRRVARMTLFHHCLTNLRKAEVSLSLLLQSRHLSDETP